MTKSIAKTVLITRPQSQGISLSAQLVQQGFVVHHIPVMEIETLSHEDHPHIQSIFSQIHLYDGIILVSVNAAEQALPWLKKFPLATHTQMYAVGKTTAAFVEQQTVTAERYSVCYPSSQMDSEGLLALPDLQRSAVNGRRFLILRGVGGREHIAQTLQERGAQVESCELYKRYMPDNQQVLQQCLPSCDALQINSSETLGNLLTLAGATLQSALREKMLLVPSERVAIEAQRLGFRYIISASNATDAAVIEALDSWAANF